MADVKATFGDYARSIAGQLESSAQELYGQPSVGHIAPRKESYEAAERLFRKGKYRYIHWNGYGMWSLCRRSDGFVSHRDDEWMARQK